MGISSPGIGSNLDVNSIVSQLMAVERQPLTTLSKKESSFQAKLSGFGTLKSALSQFQTAVAGLSDISKFQSVRAATADPTIATVSATAAATPGTFALEVNKLAQAQKLAAAGQASDGAAISNGVISFDFGTINGTADSAGKYGAGTTFASNGSGIKTVTIDDTNHSLSGIRDAINKANIGVSATIVNDGGASPYRLALTVNATGKSSSLKISVADDVAGGSTALSTLLNHDPSKVAGQAFAETVLAQNAEFKIDGIAVSKTTNTVSDAIAGVTLNLAKTNSGSTTSITVARDTASALSSVNAFVKSYNDINQTLKDAAAYDPATKSTAILNGEASVRTIATQIRGVLSTPVAGGASAFSLLSQVGVTLQKDGSLKADPVKLQAAMDSNFSDFAGLFAATGKTSDSLVAYSGASSTTVPGAYGVTVSQLATKGSTAGTAALAAPNLDIDSTNDTLQVQLDGVAATITLGHATPGPTTYANAAAIAAEVQSKVNGAAEFVAAGSSATVNQAGGVLTITSNRFGSASKASITGGTGQANLKFGAGAAINAGLDIAGTINGVAATGSGQFLNGAAGDASEGLSLKITGGTSPGTRGTVNYSLGYATQFNKLTTSLLGTTGPIASRTDGINASLKSLAQSKQAISDRLVGIEKRYRTQFTALDVAISSMTTTSTFLTQQLAAFSKSTA